jgi:hypothetical protein
MMPYHPGQQQQPMHGQGPPAPASASGRKAKRKSSSDPVPSSAGPPAKKGAAAKQPQPQQRGKKQMSEESDQLDDGSAGGGGGGSLDGLSQTDGRPETEEEKRKNFLERNRQAALKCRQRKKAWLNELQSKVEVLTAENEGLAQTVAKLSGEVHRLQAALAGAGGAQGGLPVGGPHLQQGRLPPQPHLQQQQQLGPGSGVPSGMVAGAPHPPPPPNGGAYPHQQQQQQQGGPLPRPGSATTSRPTTSGQQPPPPHQANSSKPPPSQQPQRLPLGQPAAPASTSAYVSAGPAQAPPVAAPPKVRV